MRFQFCKKIESRGQSSLGTIIISLVFVVAAVFCYRLTATWFQRAKVEALISTQMLSSRGAMGSEEFKEQLVKGLEQELGVKVKRESILIYYTEDRSRMRVDLEYSAPVRLPYLGWGWDMGMSISQAEKLTRSTF